MHRWIRHATGLDADSLAVDLEHVTLSDGIDQFRILLPDWAAHISKVTTRPPLRPKGPDHGRLAAAHIVKQAECGRGG